MKIPFTESEKFFYGQIFRENDRKQLDKFIIRELKKPFDVVKRLLFTKHRKAV